MQSTEGSLSMDFFAQGGLLPPDVSRQHLYKQCIQSAPQGAHGPPVHHTLSPSSDKQDPELKEHGAHLNLWWKKRDGGRGERRETGEERKVPTALEIIFEILSAVLPARPRALCLGSRKTSVHAEHHILLHLPHHKLRTGVA